VGSQRLKKALEGVWNNFKVSMPILVGVLLLVGLANSAIPKGFYARLFTGRSLLDLFVGALLGSVAAGNPVTSYVIGGELLENGVGLTAVLAFIVSWVDALKGRWVVMRAFDLGADKRLPYLDRCLAQNPSLGIRGIRRHLLRRPEELRTQLRALLRAAVEFTCV